VTGFTAACSSSTFLRFGKFEALQSLLSEWSSMNQGMPLPSSAQEVFGWVSADVNYGETLSVSKLG